MISSRTYTEVYEVLQILGDEYINRIPIQLYKYIEEQRNTKSILEIDVNKDISEQDISEEASNFIAYLNLQYWCNKEEKEKLLKQYRMNDIEYEKELNEKYNKDSIFKNKY